MFIQVTASAGSGKTYQLTRRFLTLLLGAGEGPWPPACRKTGQRRHAPAEIMAITFTNKAAAEMKERLVASLKSLALELDGAHGPEGFTPEIAARHLDDIFRHYQRLQIRTIDSLLVMLARLFAVELGLSPDFETVFDEAEILAPLYDRLISRAEAGTMPEAGLLARAANGFSGAGGFLPATVWNERLRAMFSLRLAGSEELTTDPQVFLSLGRQTRDAAVDAAKRLETELEAAGCKAKAQFAAFLAKCRALEPAKEPADSAFAAKESLAECLLAASAGKLTPGLEQSYAAFKQAVAGHAETASLVSSALDLAALAELADALARGLEGEPAERGRTAHSRVALMVHQALARDMGVPEAFCRLGARLAHLLIDEFQDTSRAQWRALAPLAQECLAKGGGLFMVGDVKQAIYGWRGGDASLFAETAADPELCAVAAPEFVDLEHNWRSAARVVAFNNAFFSALADPALALATAEALAPLIPARHRELLAGRIAAAFSRAKQSVPDARANRPEGLVSLTPTPGSAKDDITAGVKQALRETLSGDILRRRAPGEAAILVRTNDLAAEVSRWLLEWGIASVTDNSLRLADRPVIRELTALLAFLDYPLNDAAFWEFASGPHVLGAVSGLAREPLCDWLAGLGPGSLYPKFRRDFPLVWERLIRPYFSQAGLMTAYDLTAEIIKSYRLLTRAPGDEGFLRRFLEVVHVAGEKGHGSLAAFLDFWRRKGAEETAPRPEHLDAVRIMTMHKAKGLEFPVVIAPFQAVPAPKADEPAVIERFGLRFAAKLSPRAGEPYSRRIEARAMEQLNLLYVCFTRAAEELHLFVQPGAAPSSPLLDTTLTVLRGLGIDASVKRVELGERPPRPAQGRPGQPEARPDPAQAAEPAQAAGQLTPAAPHAPPQTGPEQDIPAEPMRWLPRLKVYRNAVTELKPGVVLTETARGEAAHKAMEHLRPGLDPEAAAALAVRLALKDLTLPESALARLEAELSGMLAWALTVPGLAALLDAGEREREILDVDGKTHRPDLYAEDPRGVTVVDYKTGTPDPEHAVQVRRYLRLLREMRPDLSARGLIVYLDARRVAAVDPHAPEAGRG
jgi:ATP-dependent helicase/nuclease subunit A